MFGYLASGAHFNVNQTHWRWPYHATAHGMSLMANSHGAAKLPVSHAEGRRALLSGGHPPAAREGRLPGAGVCGFPQEVRRRQGLCNAGQAASGFRRLPRDRYARHQDDRRRQGIRRGERHYDGQVRIPDDLRRAKGPAGEAARRKDPNLRIYVPFGDQWYPYFTRRLAERPANVFFIMKTMFRG